MSGDTDDCERKKELEGEFNYPASVVYQRAKENTDLREKLAHAQADSAMMRAGLEVAYEKLTSLSWKGGAAGPSWITIPQKALSTTAGAELLSAARFALKSFQDEEKRCGALYGHQKEVLTKLRAALGEL